MQVSEFARFRLGNQLLAGRRPREVADVVRRLGALQAQDYGQSLWAVGSRLGSGTVTDVERALADGAIVRSWPMRGTIHLMAAEDLRWLLALCAPRILASDARRLAQLDLTERDVTRAAKLTATAFGRSPGLLSRAGLMAAFEDAGLATTGQRGYHLLWRLGQEGLICIGPPRGAEQTFALLDDWVPASAPLDRDAALARMASRFGGSRGPVTAHDLARWSGLTVTDARQGLHDSGLPRHEVGGRDYWAPAVPAPRAWRKPLLLAGFDEYLIGYRGRDELIDPAHADKVVPGGNGVYKPMLVLDGRIVGTWRRTVGRRRLRVEVHPFEPGTTTPSALEAPVAAYRRFFGLPAATVDVG